MPKATKPHGDRSFIDLLAASIREQSSRYDKLIEAGGFPIEELIKKSGKSRAACDAYLRTRPNEFFYVKVLKPSTARYVAVWFKAGTEVPE